MYLHTCIIVHVPTYLYTEPSNGDGRPPIEVDLVNGVTVDLTNGLGEGTGPTNTPSVDLTGNNDDDNNVPELFPGYDDNDYDPSEYDDYYGDDDESGIRRGGGGGQQASYGNSGGGSRPQPQPGYAFGGRPRSDDANVALRNEEDEEYSDSNRRGTDSDDPSRRKGKKVSSRVDKKDDFEPAVYDDEYEDEEGPFLEYTELDSEPQQLDDGEGGRESAGDAKKDEDAKFVSVPLVIEEVGGDTGTEEGDPTVIVLGTPEEEEEEYDDEYYYDENYEDEELEAEEEASPATTFRTPVTAVVVGRGAVSNNLEQRQPKEEDRSKKVLKVRRTKKRVEDIPHSAFHAFLTEQPQGRRNVQTKRELTKPWVASTTRGVADWSQRLREKRRQRVWNQFRLN